MTEGIKLTDKDLKIETLLTWYRDALESMDRSNDLSYSGAKGSVCLLMCDMWRHPSYRELERVRVRMRDEEPRLYWHVAETYIRVSSRTVLMCPECRQTEPIEARNRPKFKLDEGPRGSVPKHKHDGNVVFFVQKVVPVVSAAVDPDTVKLGVRWLANQFRGEPFIPDEILNRDKKRKVAA